MEKSKKEEKCDSESSILPKSPDIKSLGGKSLTALTWTSPKSFRQDESRERSGHALPWKKLRKKGPPEKATILWCVYMYTYPYHTRVKDLPGIKKNKNKNIFTTAECAGYIAKYISDDHLTDTPCLLKYTLYNTTSFLLYLQVPPPSGPQVISLLQGHTPDEPFHLPLLRRRCGKDDYHNGFSGS